MDNTIQDQLKKAAELCNKGRMKAAEPILRELVKQDPKVSDAWRLLGQIDLFTNHDVDKAEDELIEALNLQPDNLQAVLMMGNLQGLGRGDKEVAKQYYDKALKIDSGNIVALNNIGGYYMGKQDFDTGIKYFNTAIKAEPTFANGYYGIAICQASLKDYQQAFDTCIEGLKKGKRLPENPKVLSEMQRLLERMAEYVSDEHKSDKKLLKLIQGVTDALIDESGHNVKFVEGDSLSVNAQMEYYLWHHTNESVIRYKSDMFDTPHETLHELLHLKMCIDNTKAGKGKMIVNKNENRKAFDQTYKKIIRKLHKNLPPEGLDEFCETVLSGIVQQVTSTPIDLFVEEKIYNDYPLLRPWQVQSLYAQQEAYSKAASDNQYKGILPLHLEQATIVMNIVGALHLRRLYGADFVPAYHATKLEIDQATDLYEEYKAYIDTYKIGDEYELIDYFASSLHLTDFFAIENEPEEESDDETFERIANEVADMDDPGLSKEDVDAENAAFALIHQDGADTNQTTMMAMYMLGAMTYLDKLTDAQVNNIALEIAKLGVSGINPDNHYTLTTIPGKDFGGWQILAYMYVSFKRVNPAMLAKMMMPFDKAYDMALAMYKSKKK